MALAFYTFESRYLKGNTQISVILPELTPGADPVDFYSSGKKYKVLWLLHGTFGDHTDWVRNTGIELYAKERDLIVVMPGALNSNYSNWNHFMLGYNMYDFLIRELMPLIHNWLPASDRREDNFICGLSMGGRGCIKYAVHFPELFAGAAVLSAIPVDFSKMEEGHPNAFLNPQNERTAASIQNAGGMDAYIYSEENVWAVIDKKAPLNILPKLFFACGESDALIYESFLHYQKHCSMSGIRAEWFSLPGYGHEWRFWDLAVQKALDCFGISPVRKY